MVCHFPNHPEEAARERVFLRADETLQALLGELQLRGPSDAFAAREQARKEAELAAVRGALVPLVAVKVRTDAEASRSARAGMRVAFGGLTGLIAFYTYLVFARSWDEVEPMVWMTLSVGSMAAYAFWLATSRSFQFRDLHTTIRGLRKRNLYRDALLQDPTLHAAVLRAMHPRQEHESAQGPLPDPADTLAHADAALLAHEFDERIDHLREAERQVLHELHVLRQTGYNPALIAHFDTTGPDTRLRTGREPKPAAALAKDVRTPRKGL